MLTGARLESYGTVGHLEAMSGATVAAGSHFWVPPLTTSNLTLQAGSTLQLKLYGSQSNNLVRVRGTATLTNRRWNSTSNTSPRSATPSR